LSQQAVVSLLTAVLFVGFAIFLPGFFTLSNIIGLLQSVATLGLLGLGMGVIVIARGIDLSMIATLAVPSAVVLNMVAQGYDIPVSFAAALALTVAFGALNGWLIAYAEMTALFATLATGLLLYGLSGVFFRIDVLPWPDALRGWSWLGRSSLLGLPMPVVFFVLATVGFFLLLNFTRFGRYVYPLGDNPQSAKVIGIPTRPLTVLLYILSALIGFFAGLVLAAVLNAMPVRVFASTMIYDVILVVVLGGIGLSGGRGGTMSVVVGTLMIGTLLNAMTLMDASFDVQNLIKGTLLLMAIILDSRLNPRNEETAQQGDI